MLSTLSRPPLQLPTASLLVLVVVLAAGCGGVRADIEVLPTGALVVATGTELLQALRGNETRLVFLRGSLALNLSEWPVGAVQLSRDVTISTVEEVSRSVGSSPEAWGGSSAAGPCMRASTAQSAPCDHMQRGVLVQPTVLQHMQAHTPASVWQEPANT